MEKTNNRDNQQSRLRAFLAGDTFKALLPLIGFAVIIIVLNIMTQGRILTPKKLRLLLSSIYAPTIVATGVFFVMTLGSIDFTEGSTLGVASLVVSALSFINVPLAILGGILCGAAIGAINGFFHVKFKLQSFIVTICTMYLFRGVCAYFTTETAVPASAAIKAMDNNGLKIANTLREINYADNIASDEDGHVAVITASREAPPEPLKPPVQTPGTETDPVTGESKHAEGQGN